MPLASLLGLSVALHLYIGARIVPALSGTFPAAMLALMLMLVASTLFVPMGLVARRIVKPPAASALTWAGLLFMGLLSSLLVFTCCATYCCCCYGS